MAAGRPIKYAITGDAKDFQRAMQQTEQALDGAEQEARKSGRSIESAFSSAADAADEGASSSSQLAGGIGDVAGALEATGVISEGTAQSLAVAEASIMGATGAFDLMNLTMTKFPKLGKAVAAAQRAIGVATKFMLGPVGLVILAIAAVIAIFVALYKNNETFRRFVDEKLVPAFRRVAQWAKDKIVPALKVMWQWFKDRVIPIIKAVARWFTGTLIPAMVRTNSRVVSVVQSIVRWFGRMRDGAGNVIRAVRDRFNSLVSFIRGIPGRVGGSLSRMWSGLGSGFRSVVNGIIGGWNRLSFSIGGGSFAGVSIPSASFSTPNIPYLANGGITTGPTVAMIGDNKGGREAVIPLDKYDLGGGDTYNINVSVGPGASLVETGRAIVKAIRAYNDAGGKRISVA
jgi:hypothetical protein